MVRAILGDVNLEGHIQVLLRVWQGEDWREFWADLNLVVLTFEDLGLAHDAPDSLVWQTCQQHQAVLITSNRNADGPSSLEVTIRDQNGPDSLPVFTIADAKQVPHSPSYARRVAERLLQSFYDIDNYRGTGRLYVP